MAEREAKKLVKALKHWAIANNKTQCALAKLLEVDREREGQPLFVLVLLSLAQRHCHGQYVHTVGFN